MIKIWPLLFGIIIPRHVRAIVLWPFIIIKRTEDREDQVLMNHERIHMRQQLELLIVPFYFLYVAMFLIGLLRGLSRYEAYMAIAFEREAYAHEQDESYLQSRKLWSWWKYRRDLQKI